MGNLGNLSIIISFLEDQKIKKQIFALIIEISYYWGYWDLWSRIWHLFCRLA